MQAPMSPPSDDPLLSRALRRDRDAFDSVVDAFRGRLATLVRFRLGAALRSRVEVDDVLQEALLRAFQAVERVDCPNRESFFRWLATIADHVVVDLARRHQRHSAVPLDRHIAADAASPSTGLRRDERFDRLQAALDSLSRDHREVILLARIHGLCLGEVAARMKRSYAATAQLLCRALRELRASFGDTASSSLPDRRFRPGGDDAAE